MFGKPTPKQCPEIGPCTAPDKIGLSGLPSALPMCTACQRGAAVYIHLLPRGAAVYPFALPTGGPFAGEHRCCHPCVWQCHHPFRTRLPMGGSLRNDRLHDDRHAAPQRALRCDSARRLRRQLPSAAHVRGARLPRSRTGAVPFRLVPPWVVEPPVLSAAHCASLCCFPAPSLCCCPARTHGAGRAGREPCLRCNAQARSLPS